MTSRTCKYQYCCDVFFLSRHNLEAEFLETLGKAASLSFFHFSTLKSPHARPARQTRQQHAFTAPQHLNNLQSHHFPSNQIRKIYLLPSSVIFDTVLAHLSRLQSSVRRRPALRPPGILRLADFSRLHNTCIRHIHMRPSHEGRITQHLARSTCRPAWVLDLDRGSFRQSILFRSFGSMI